MADVVHENAQAILREAGHLDADIDFLGAQFERLADQNRAVLRNKTQR